jgi:hypothetical protein
VVRWARCVNVCRVCSIWGTNVDLTYIIGVRY